MKCCVCFVVYNEYNDYNYTKLFFTSFLKVFKNEVKLFAVNNGSKVEEVNFLKKNKVEVIENTTNDKSHGKGLDLAVNHVYKLGYDSVVFLEPDCFIYDKIWYDNLLKSIQQGFHMASCGWHSAGWLHICGSIWLINKIPCSFKSCRRSLEEIHSPEFRQLNLGELMNDKDNRGVWHFYFYHWDVGVKNYFLIKKNKKKLVKDTGFNHLWNSHKTSFLNKFKENKKEFYKIGRFYLNNVNKIL